MNKIQWVHRHLIKYKTNLFNFKNSLSILRKDSFYLISISHEQKEWATHSVFAIFKKTVVWKSLENCRSIAVTSQLITNYANFQLPLCNHDGFKESLASVVTEPALWTTVTAWQMPFFSQIFVFFFYVQCWCWYKLRIWIAFYITFNEIRKLIYKG